MNIPLVLKTIGLFLLLLALTMLIPLFWAFYFHEPSAPFLQSIGSATFTGGLLYFCFRKEHRNPQRKDGFAIVVLCWISAAAFGSLPYLFGGVFTGAADAFFETMSGFTTTGASVMQDIESVDKSILFWRSQTHWLGGMGIIVLFVAILPFLGTSGRQMFHSEAPGPMKDSLKPRIIETARVLWFIYLGFTVLETVLLMTAGLSLFEALCHTFGTLATGGFSTRNASIASFQSPYVEWIITVFMLAAGANFALYYHMLGRRMEKVYKDTEVRTYLKIFIFGTLFVFLVLMFTQNSGITETIRVSAFQCASILTTTGYCTADFNQWHASVKIVLVIFMFIGGSGGSTGGGMKVVRVLLLYKVMKKELIRIVHPSAVEVVKLGDMQVEDGVVRNVVGFFVLAIFIFLTGTIFIAMSGADMVTSASAVAATMWNIGPGLEKVGAVENYAFFSTGAKFFLSLLMLVGRLELFTVIVLFTPIFWRK